MSIKLGSLFDGSGGFPLAGCLCGVEPVWASEVEPYPIAVTRSRFPNMKHLGDICTINGAEIEPVDIITFGSPCQSLSISGKRHGIKHVAKGDKTTTRSGLFIEAIRIIKEMRCATHGKYPRFCIFENVPGTFSCDGGEAFRIILQEFINIVEPQATVPQAPKGGWPYADTYLGDGWSLAYRTFDAQYWGKTVIDRDSGALLQLGTPQRRRRLYAIADLTGGCAPGILFKRESLRRDIEESKSTWKGAPAAAERGAGTDDTKRNTFIKQSSAGRNDVAACLCASYATKWNGNAGVYSGENFVLETHIAAEGLDGYNNTLTEAQAATLGVNCGMSTGRNGVLIAAGFKAGQGVKAKGIGWQEEVVPTLTGVPSGTNQVPAVCTAFTQNQRNEVRDLRGKVGALAANAGAKQQTYVIQERISNNQSEHGMDDAKASPPLSTKMHGNAPWEGQNEEPVLREKEKPLSDDDEVYCIQGNCVDRKARCNGKGWRQGASFALNTIDRPAVAYAAESKVPNADTCCMCMASGQGNTEIHEDLAPALHCNHDKQIVFEGYQYGGYREGCGSLRASGGDYGGGSENIVLNHQKNEYIVRRLTPVECARLQGFPDGWGVPEHKGTFTEEEYVFWHDVRNRHAAMNGKKERDYTKEQMITWYNKLHSKSSEYKMWGNGIALPPTLFCMKGVRDVLYEKEQNRRE